MGALPLGAGAPSVSEAWCLLSSSRSCFAWPGLLQCCLSVTGSQAHRLLSHQTVADEEDVTTQQIAARRVTRGREPSTGVGTHVTVGFTEQRMLRPRLEGKAAATCYQVAVGWDQLCSGEAEWSLPLALRPLLLPAPRPVGEETEASYPRPHSNKRQRQGAAQARLTPESELLTALLVNSASL